VEWEKIGVGLIAVVAIFFFFPGVLKATKDTRKGSTQEWKGFLLPIGLVILFVVFLIMSVR